MPRPFKSIDYKSADGLRLYVRDYAGIGSGPVLFCMHGLTRNSADFEPFAAHFPKHRIICVDQRGRGLSDYDPNPDHYNLNVYCRDMFTLIEHLNLQNIIAIGTSMGGLMSMMMAALRPGVFNGVVINDIGLEVDPNGIARLQGYVGQTSEFLTWEAAAQSMRQQGPDLFPDFTDADWKAFAQRACHETPEGRIRFAYDPAIQKGLKAGQTSTVPPNLWTLFEALYTVPVLLIRGETSDILSKATASAMQAAHPNLTYVNIANRGHAPILDEPQCLTALRAFLGKLS